MSLIVSPDCRDQNHQKCPGDAWDEPHDHDTECQCTCHTEQRPASTDLRAKPIHYVKIVDGQMKFECQDTKAKCHTYPACDCEQWNDDHPEDYGVGHETIHHEQCWMQDWFDVPGATYTGDEFTDMTDTGVPEDMNREGYIRTSCDGEILEFEFEDVTAPAELTYGELDNEMTELHETEQQDSERFKLLWAEAEKRGLL